MDPMQSPSDAVSSTLIWKSGSKQISTATRCARNAACSASSAIPTPRRSPRSACTPCSIAARRRPASSPSTARFHTERRLGLVGDTFSRREVIERLPGNAAIGHTRYSTTGGTFLRNVQPMFADIDAGGLALAPQRQPDQLPDPAAQLVAHGAMFQSTSDTEVILHLVARSKRNRFIDRFIEALREIEGGYALVSLTNKKLIGVRDPLGIRPLVLGELDGKPVLASETCALDMIGAEIRPRHRARRGGRDRRRGLESHKPFPPMPPPAPASSNTSISRART